MSGSSKVSKGDTVTVNVPPAQNNGDSEALGLVLRVLDVENETRVNVKVFLDGDGDMLLRNVPVLSKTDAKKDDAPSKRAVRF